MKLFLLLFSFLLTSIAQADPSLSSFDLPVCHDINGVPVREGVIADISFGPAFSTVSQNAPAIFVNWAEMKKYSSSRDTIRFILEHECGHCALGHIYTNTNNLKKTNKDELDADCYAAKQAKSLGINIQNVIKDVDLLPRDPSHPSGLVRAKNIQKCYNQKS